MTGHADAWIADYAAAWRARDATRVGLLFSPDTRYSFDPFAPPLTLPEVVEHWRTAFAIQREVDLSVRLVAEDGATAVVEWWASILGVDDEGVTLSATLLLHFVEDGRCDELHEHWLRHDGRLSPPERFT
jgi:hypothetical protein